MRLLIAQGVETFIEVGPGKVLCGLMRQIDRSKTCVNVGDEASLAKTLEALGAMLPDASNKACLRASQWKISSQGGKLSVLSVFLHPDLRMLRAVVHDHIHDHSGAGTRASARSIDFFGLDQAPLAARSPIAIELVERIFRMLLRMLLPLRIVHPDAVGGLVILLLEASKNFPTMCSSRPIAEPPAQAQQITTMHDTCDMILRSVFRAFSGSYFLRVQKCHTSLA